MKLVKRNIDQQDSVDIQTQQVSHFLYFPINTNFVNCLLMEWYIATRAHAPTVRGRVPVDDRMSGTYKLFQNTTSNQVSIDISWSIIKN